MKADIEPIRQAVTVQCDPGRAFDLFTNQMGTWWPVDSYSRAVSEFQHEDAKVAELVFQARMGGSILERLTDGRILPWGGGNRLATAAPCAAVLAAALCA
jgi:hypothetical protein